MKVIDKNLLKGVEKIYLIGIGGSGMSGLARVLKYMGFSVSGSDKKKTSITEALEKSNIPVYVGQKISNVGDSELIVYSSAINNKHIEIKNAKKLNKKLYHRAQILASLLNHAKTSVAITGTHGKTTTSAILSFALTRIGANPTCIVGSEMLNFKTNVVEGGGNYWVCEVDESDSSHEFYAPNYSIITNLEPEHLDHYQNIEGLENSFKRFLDHAKNPGLVVYQGDDEFLKKLVKKSKRPNVSFGFSISCDFSAQNISLKPFESEFDIFEAGFFIKRMKLNLPGKHNISNALSAICVLIYLGFDLEEIEKALSGFSGTRRRLEVKWQSREFTIVDDYAHHPTEVEAAIKTLRGMGKHVVAVFQPHRYSRTKHLYREFAHVFDDADKVILTDIYSAGEKKSSGVDVNLIFNEVCKSGHKNVSILKKEKIVSSLSSYSERNSVIAFIGAGDIGEIADEFVSNLKA